MYDVRCTVYVVFKFVKSILNRTSHRTSYIVHRTPYIVHSSYLQLMKVILFIILSGFFVQSCKESAIRKSFSSADSLVIHFKDEQKGEILKTVQTAETRAIGRLADFIDAPATKEFKCGYDGK